MPAVPALNHIIGVDSTDELPKKWRADSALAVLDRGVLLQSLQRFDASARDLSAAEEELELIDITKDPVGTLAGYVYSDTKKPYKATPTERLALNGVNLLNYLAEGDVEGAAVEARRRAEEEAAPHGPARPGKGAVEVVEALRLDLAANYAKKIDLERLDRKIEKLVEHMTVREHIYDRRGVEDAETK